MANLLEEELIRKYNSTDRNLGYNLRFGGGNSEHNPETIEKRRQAMLGRHHTIEARRKMSEGHKNPSEETRRRISEAGKGRKKTHSQIEAIRKAIIGNRYRVKPINQYGRDGKFIKRWECAKDV